MIENKFLDDGAGLVNQTLVETFTAYTTGFYISRGNTYAISKQMLHADLATPYDVSKYDYVICNRLISQVATEGYYTIDGFWGNTVNPSTGVCTFVAYADGNNVADIVSLEIEFIGIKIDNRY